MENNNMENRIKESFSPSMETKVVSLNLISMGIYTGLIKKIFSDF